MLQDNCKQLQETFKPSAGTCLKPQGVFLNIISWCQNFKGFNQEFSCDISPGVAYMSSQIMSLLCAGLSQLSWGFGLNSLNSRSDHHEMLEMCTALWEQHKAAVLQLCPTLAHGTALHSACQAMPESTGIKLQSSVTSKGWTAPLLCLPVDSFLSLFFQEKFTFYQNEGGLSTVSTGKRKTLFSPPK